MAKKSEAPEAPVAVPDPIVGGAFAGEVKVEQHHPDGGSAPDIAAPAPNKLARHHAEDHGLTAAQFDAFRRRHSLTGDEAMTDAEFQAALRDHLHGRL